MLAGKTRRIISKSIMCFLILVIISPSALAALPHENPDEAPQIYSGLALFRYYADSLDFVLKKEPVEVEARLQKMPFANLPQNLRDSTDKFTPYGIEISYLINDIDKNIGRMRTLVNEFRLSESIELSTQILSTLSRADELVEKLKTASKVAGVAFNILNAPTGSNLRMSYDGVLERIDRIKELLDLYRKMLSDLQGKSLMINNLMLPTELSLKIEPSSAFVGDSVNFEGALTSDSRPLPGREIAILVNGSSMASALTGEDGNYKGSLRVPYWYIPEMDIQVLYYPKDKDIGLYISSVSPVTKLKVLFYQAKLKLKIEGKTYPGVEKEIYGEFDYGQSPPPVMRKVEIYLDNILIGEGTVDTAFVKKISIRPDISSGKHTLTLSAEAAKRYSPVIADANLNVGQAITTLDIDIPRIALIPGKIGLRGKLRSELGPLKGATINIRMGNSQVKLMTQDDGSFTGQMSLGLALNIIGSGNLRLQVAPEEPWNAPLSTTKNVVTVNMVSSGIIIFLMILSRRAYLPRGFRIRSLWYRRKRIRPELATVFLWRVILRVLKILKSRKGIRLKLAIAFLWKVMVRVLKIFRHRKRINPELAAAPAEPIPVYSASRLEKGRTGKNQELEGGPREIILYFYKLLMRFIQGIAKRLIRPHHTLREFAHENSKILGPFSTYFLELTKVVEKLIYSRYRPDEEDALKFKQLSSNIEEGLKNRNV